MHVLNQFISQSFKAAMALYNTLSPGSELHKKRDLNKLKVHVLEVEALMRSLPATITRGWEDDLEIARRGIVETAKAPPKQAKPELNVEDLAEF